MKRILLTIFTILTASVAFAQMPYDPVTRGMPLIGFAQTPNMVEEGNGPFDITVVLSAPTDKDVLVNYTITGNMPNQTQYQLGQGTLSIPSGQTAINLTVPAVDDNVISGNQIVTIILSNPQYAVFGSSVFTFTIRDDDGQSNETVQPMVRFAGHNGNTVQLVLNIAQSQDASVDYDVTVTSVGSQDMRDLGTGTVSFPAGSTSATVQMPAYIDPNEIPLPQTYTTYLSNPQNLTIYEPLFSFTRSQ